MEKIRLWLERRPSFLSLWKVIPYITCSNMLYAVVACLVLKGLPESKSMSSGTGSSSSLFDTHLLIAAAVWEELIFRFIPLLLIQGVLILYRIGNNISILILLLGVAVTSSIFGYLHGNYLNIFIQGVSGVIYSFLFLKYGGYIVTKKNGFFGISQGLYVCSLAHTTFNFAVVHFL